MQYHIAFRARFTLFNFHIKRNNAFSDDNNASYKCKRLRRPPRRQSAISVCVDRFGELKATNCIYLNNMWLRARKPRRIQHTTIGGVVCRLYYVVGHKGGATGNARDSTTDMHHHCQVVGVCRRRSSGNYHQCILVECILVIEYGVRVANGNVHLHESVASERSTRALVCVCVCLLFISLSHTHTHTGWPTGFFIRYNWIRVTCGKHFRIHECFMSLS